MNRIADVKEDVWESLYEKRSRKKALATDNTIEHEVDPVDALPVKTLDGELYYRTGNFEPFFFLLLLIGLIKTRDFRICWWYFDVVTKGPSKFENAKNADETVGENEDVSRDNGVLKLTKAEKRVKFKKLRKEAKKQGKDVTEEVEPEEVQPNSQAEVLVLFLLILFCYIFVFIFSQPFSKALV